MPSKLVIALALSPAAARSSRAWARWPSSCRINPASCETRFRNLLQRKAHSKQCFDRRRRARLHNISDVKKREIQEGRARPRGGRSREQNPAAQVHTRPRARCRAHVAPALPSTKDLKVAAIDFVAGCDRTRSRRSRPPAPPASRASRSSPRRRRCPDRRPRGRRVQGPGHRPGRHRQSASPRAASTAALLNHDLHAIDATPARRRGGAVL